MLFSMKLMHQGQLKLFIELMCQWLYDGGSFSFHNERGLLRGSLDERLALQCNLLNGSKLVFDFYHHGTIKRIGLYFMKALVNL